MKMEGVMNGGISNPSSSNTHTTVDKPNTKEVKERQDKDSYISSITEKQIAHLSSEEKKDLPVADRVVIDAIEKANKAISGGNREFHFAVHEKTKQIMVKVINSDTNEVIRELPPEKILDMVAKMWEMAGIIVDEKG